jgi:hypothetical protein
MENEQRDALRLFITAIIEIEELLKTNVMANNQVK